jgi:hypothetical protein
MDQPSTQVEDQHAFSSKQTSYKFTPALGGKYNSFTYSVIEHFGVASMISLNTIRENLNGN